MALGDDRNLLFGVAIVLAAVLLAYSVLIVGDLLFWIGPVFTVGLLYLLWRAVRALERAADALE